MSTENKSQTAEVEVLEALQPSAIHALERAAIDTQVATAHQYPRSIETFKKRALAMVTLDEDTAESCIYYRPVGKEQNDRGQWVEKIAEGPSIRMAEIVACSYGNIRAASRIIEQTPRFVKCEGVCHDLESNYAGKSEVVEPTVKKDGTPYSERQRAVVAKVCLAKAYRDGIFKVVPRALCKPLMNAAKLIITGDGKPLEERRKKVQAWVGTLKIDQERVFTVLGVKGWADVTDDHLMMLTGFKTAISEGEKIDEIFPPIPKGPAKEGPPEEDNVPLPENKAKTTEAAKEGAGAIDAAAGKKLEKAEEVIDKPYEHLLGLIKQAEGITNDDVHAWMKANKLAGASTEDLGQAHESKLREVIAKWPNVKDAIKKMAAEKKG